MYAGRLVEVAETKEFFENALHPYSRVLMAAVPKPVVMDDKDELYRGIGKIAKRPGKGARSAPDARRLRSGAEGDAGAEGSDRRHSCHAICMSKCVIEI